MLQLLRASGAKKQSDTRKVRFSDEYHTIYNESIVFSLEALSLWPSFKFENLNLRMIFYSHLHSVDRKMILLKFSMHSINKLVVTPY